MSSHRFPVAHAVPHALFVVRLPIGTRALQEAMVAGRRAQRVLEGRAGAGEGESVAPVARAGQRVKEPARGGDPADRGGAACRAG